MNNPQKNGFKDFKVCDTHIHIVFPETVDSSEKILSEIIEYFGYSRIAIQCLTTGSGHRDFDYANNLKALYLKEKLTEEKNCIFYFYFL